MIVRMFMDLRTGDDKEIFKNISNTGWILTEWKFPHLPRVGEHIAPSIILNLLFNTISSNIKFTGRTGRMFALTKRQTAALMDGGYFEVWHIAYDGLLDDGTIVPVIHLQNTD